MCATNIKLSEEEEASQRLDTHNFRKIDTIYTIMYANKNSKCSYVLVVIIRYEDNVIYQCV